MRLADALDVLGPRDAAFTRGEGPLDVTLAGVHGVLAVPTHVTAASPGSEASLGGVTLDTGLRATFDVRPSDGGKPMATARLEAEPLDLTKDDGAHAHAATAVFEVTSRELELSQAFGDATVRANVQSAETQSLQAWLPPSPRPSPETDIQSGRVTANAELEGTLAELRGHGHLSFSIADLAVATASARASATVTASLVVNDASVREQFFALGDSQVVLHDARVARPGASLAARTLSVRGQLSAALGAHTVDGRVTVEADDLTARQRALEARANLRAHIGGSARWEDGSVDLAASDVLLERVLVRASQAELRVPSVAVSTDRLSVSASSLRGSVAMDVPRMETDDVPGLLRALTFPPYVAIDRGAASASLRVRVDLSSQTASGTVAVDGRGLEGHLASKALAGNLSLRLHAEPRGGATDLATITFDGAPPPADSSAEAWWARASSPRRTFALPGASHCTRTCT